jgi:hypothetical protein
MNAKRILLVAAIILFAVGTANAQNPVLTSSNAQVSLSLSIGESLSISASPASISFTNYNYTNGTAQASGPITLVTSGNFNAGHAFVGIYGWLSSASAALSGPSNVPSSDVFSSFDSGAAVPCNASTLEPNTSQMGGTVTGASCGPSLIYVSSPPAGPFNETDTVLLSLNGATNLTPGSYVGTINFQADLY